MDLGSTTKSVQLDIRRCESRRHGKRFKANDPGCTACCKIEDGIADTCSHVDNSPMLYGEASILFAKKDSQEISILPCPPKDELGQMVSPRNSDGARLTVDWPAKT